MASSLRLPQGKPFIFRISNAELNKPKATLDLPARHLRGIKPILALWRKKNGFVIFVTNETCKMVHMDVVFLFMRVCADLPSF